MSSLILLLVFFAAVVYFYNLEGETKPFFENDILIPIGSIYSESKTNRIKDNTVTPSEARKIALEVVRKTEKERSRAAEQEAKKGTDYNTMRARQVSTPSVVAQSKPKAQSKAQPKAQPKAQQQESPLFNDGVLALSKLGYKKKEAIIIVNKLISEGVTDLNELVLRAFKK
jgi:hypothetical protein